MQSKSITFLRDVGLMLLLLYLPFFKSVAQQPTYIKPIKYTDVNFNVYFAHCDHPDVVYTVNGVPLSTTVLFASGGFIANRFDYGILKAGDTFTVTNTCDGTSISRIVEDDYSYIGIPNGSTYIGNGISPSDTDPPYSRLHTPVQLGKCEVVKNVQAHILDSYLFSMNANAHYGVFKHNGVPIKKSDYIEDHYGQTGVVWDINPDGSAYTDNPTTLTSLVSYSGNTPEIISYTHNGATITDDLTLQFGGLAIRYIKNGAYSIEKYTATQFERVDYTGNFENSTFEIRYGASKIEAWVDGVKVDELVREVIYSVSGGGSISNASVLPYGNSVDFMPTTSGDYVISAIINKVRRVEQKIHISSNPDGVNSVENAICSNGTGKITANINQKGYAPLSYRINGGSWGNSNVFPNLTPGNYKIEVKDGSGCTFTSDETVGFNSALPNLTVSNKTCSTDLTTYNLSFTSTGIVTSDYGVVSGNMVNGIPAGQSVTLTATSTGGCQTTLLVSAPSCNCPSVNAPVSSGDKVICSTSTIPSLNVTIGTNETANWYDGLGVLLLSGSTSYTPSASGTYYVEAQNTNNGCKSSSKTAVKLTINVAPNLTASNKNCSSDLKTYSVSFTSDGTVTSDYGVVSGNMVSGIPSGQSVTLIATSTSNCQTTLLVSAPSCTCPTVNAPVSTTGNQVSTCKGTSLPVISASVGTNETIDWYSASTGGLLLESGSLTYQPKTVGTYFAEARNTINGCISSNRTAIMVSQNEQPKLSYSDVNCALNIKTYSLNFMSDGTVTSDYGTVSGNLVSGIPVGQTVTLTATSTSGCQTTQSVTAPTCKPCELILKADKSSIKQGESVSLSASGCPGTFSWINTGTEGSTIQVMPLMTTTYRGACWIDDVEPQCSSSITVEVSQCELSATVSSDVINQGESVTLRSEGCLNGFIAWNVAGSESGVLTVSPLSTTTYTASCWYESGASSCQVSKTIIVNPCQLSATASSELIRQGESVTLRAEGCLNGFIAWDVKGSESGVLTVSPLSTTTYTASCWYSNSNGVPSCSISKTIVVNPCELKATASKQRISQGESVTLRAEGCLNGFIAWNVEGSESGILTVSPLVTTTYTASCWYASGISSCRVSKTIEVSPCQLSATVSNEVINQGESVTLRAEGCLNGFIAWDVKGSESGVLTVSPLITTTYTASCWYSNSNGASSCSISKTVVVNPCQLTITASVDTINQGDSTVLTASGCANGRIVWDKVGGSEHQLTVSPTDPTTYKVSCYYGDIEGCSYRKTIIVNPCQIHIIAEKPNIILGETAQLKVEGCRNGRVEWQGINNDSTTITVRPLETTIYLVKCFYGNDSLSSCDTSFELKVTPCQLTSKASKSILTAGETLSIITMGCLGKLVYSSDSTQNGKSSFELIPITTGSVRISCQIEDIISCDTTIKYEVQQCSSKIVVSKQILTIGESSTLEYLGCPNTVVWKDLGTGATKRVNPEKNTMYYVSCRFGKDLAYSCSNDSVLIRVRPLPPQLTNNRNGLRGTAILDTVCLNTEFTIGAICEGKAMAYSDGQVVSETKFQAKKVGLETYKYYCQSEDGEQSEVSTFEVLVKGFEVNDAIVYPVPTSGLLHIKSKGCLDNLHLVLYTLSGQMLYQGNGEYRNAESISIDMSYLPSDEYVLHITGMEGSSQVTKRLRVVKYSK